MKKLYLIVNIFLITCSFQLLGQGQSNDTPIQTNSISKNRDEPTIRPTIINKPNPITPQKSYKDNAVASRADYTFDDGRTKGWWEAAIVSIFMFTAVLAYFFYRLVKKRKYANEPNERINIDSKLLTLKNENNELKYLMKNLQEKENSLKLIIEDIAKNQQTENEKHYSEKQILIKNLDKFKQEAYDKEEDVKQLKHEAQNLQTEIAIKTKENLILNSELNNLKSNDTLFIENESSNSIINTIRVLIQKGETNKAISVFSQFTKKRDKELFQALILQASRFETILKDRMLGSLSLSDFNSEKIRVEQSILHFLQEIEQKTNFSTNDKLNKKENRVYSYDLFLSYSSYDLKFASSVYQQLSNNGIKVFFSGETLSEHSGKSFSDTINQALQGSKNFILLWSPNAEKSEWVKAEYESFYNFIHMKNKEERKFFILKGSDFDGNSLPIIRLDVN